MQTTVSVVLKLMHPLRRLVEAWSYLGELVQFAIVIAEL